MEPRSVDAEAKCKDHISLVVIEKAALFEGMHASVLRAYYVYIYRI